jgi:hypothetical protein
MKTIIILYYFITITNNVLHNLTDNRIFVLFYGSYQSLYYEKSIKISYTVLVLWSKTEQKAKI